MNNFIIKCTIGLVCKRFHLGLKKENGRLQSRRDLRLWSKNIMILDLGRMLYEEHEKSAIVLVGTCHGCR